MDNAPGGGLGRKVEGADHFLMTCLDPRCDHGMIVHPPSAFDLAHGESRRWHTPCPFCGMLYATALGIARARS